MRLLEFRTRVGHALAARRIAPALLASWFLLGCHPQSTAPTILPLDPCCSLVIAEPIGTGFGSNDLLVSQRRGDPALDQWTRLQSQAGAFQASFRGFGFGTTLEDLKAVDVPLAQGGHEVHILAVIFSQVNVANFGFDLAEIVQGSNGAWGPFRRMGALVPSGMSGGPLGSDLGRSASFQRISAAVVSGVLSACAVEEKGQIERNRLVNGQWQGWTDVERATSGKTGIIPDGQFTDVGQFADVGCASVFDPASGADQLHVCGVTTDGKLWQSRETSPGILAPFVDVQAGAGKVGEFSKVDCAGNKSQLHLVGITRDGRAWHTILIPSGAWRPFQNVFDQAQSNGLFSTFSGNFADVAIGFCNDGVPPSGASDVSQLDAVFTSIAPAGNDQIWLTIRAVNPVRWNGLLAAQNWKPLKDISSLVERPSDAQNVKDTLARGFARGAAPRSFWRGFSVGARPFAP